MLIGDNKAHVHIKPEENIERLNFFVSGYLESVKWLVANRASLDAADIMGRRPVDLAEEHRQDAVYEFLKLCEKEQEGNPDGSFAMMRTDSRRR